MLGLRWQLLALLCAQLVQAFGPRRGALAPAPKLAAAARAEALCLRGGGEVATPIDDDEDDDDIDDGDEDDMEDDDGDDGDDDGDDGDDDEEEEEAVEESASDLDTGALKRLMIMGSITVAMHLFLPKVPDAPAEEEAASQEEEPAAEEAAPSEEEEAVEYVEEEEVEVYEDEVAEEEATA